MSNRDGKYAKINKSKKFWCPNKVCPICHSSLDKCDRGYLKGHKHHRFCKTCGYTNF